MKTLVNFVMKFYIQLNQALMTSRRSRQIERKSSFVLLFNSDFFFLNWQVVVVFVLNTVILSAGNSVLYCVNSFDFLPLFQHLKDCQPDFQLV